MKKTKYTCPAVTMITVDTERLMGVASLGNKVQITDVKPGNAGGAHSKEMEISNIVQPNLWEDEEDE